jgi:hypothetical protein
MTALILDCPVCLELDVRVLEGRSEGVSATTIGVTCEHCAREAAIRESNAT